MIFEVIFAVGVLAWWALHHASEDLPSALPEHESKDPEGTRALLARVGPPPSGMTLRLFEYTRGMVTGCRLRIYGLCPRLTLAGVDAQRTDLAVGDEAFDRSFHVLGPPVEVRALLTAKTRSVLLNFASRVQGLPFFVEGGELRIDLGGLTFESDPHGFDAIVHVALAAAARLCTQPDPAAHLLVNVRSDPEPGVRLRSLQALLLLAPHQAAKEALGVAAVDHDPEVRLEAGRAEGEAGRVVLLHLMGDPVVDDSCAARAVDALDAPTLDELGPTLTAALREEGPKSQAVRPLTARACADALGRMKGPGVVDLLGRALASSHAVVAAAAVKALERVSTAAAVPYLEEAAETHPDRDVRKAARAAVAVIQTGLDGAAPGQISLSGGEAGQVSLAEDVAGRLSTPQADVDPQTSPAHEPDVRRGTGRR